MESKNQTSPPQPQSTKGSNIALIIIIVILALIILLGVGGFLGWKYYLSKKLASSANPITTSTPTKSPTITPTLSPSPTATPTSTTTSTLKTGTMPVNSYVISDSDSRVISESELLNFTPWQLKVARNEIYARYGRPFVHKDLQCYFAQQSWYHGNPNYSDSMLSAIENKNVNTIQTYEKKINSPLQSYDSGC